MVASPLYRLRRSVAAVTLLGLLAMAGNPAPASADRVTSGGDSGGCDSWAFDASNDPFPPVGLPAAVVLTTTLVHVCPGPVQVRGSFGATLTPTAGQFAEILANVQVTCTGGCDVTGIPISPILGSLGVVSRGQALPPTVTTFPLLATFPDLPAGTYTLEVLAGGLNAQLLSGQVQAFGSGVAAGAGRPGSP